MKRAIRLVTVGALAAAVLVGVTSVAGASPGVTTCNGELGAGTYKRVVVPADAVCLSNGPVTIRGGLYIEQGATFVLGSEENPVDTGTINGGVHATDAMSVQIHFTTINGGIDVHGGSGPFGGPFDVTWNTIEDSSIHGGVTISGYNGFWMGFIRNDVRRLGQPERQRAWSTRTATSTSPTRSTAASIAQATRRRLRSAIRKASRTSLQAPRPVSARASDTAQRGGASALRKRA